MYDPPLVPDHACKPPLRTTDPRAAEPHRTGWCTADRRTGGPAGQATTAHRFADTAARFRDRYAILTDEQELTYGQLAGLAGGYARALAGAGVRAGLRVAVLVDHGPTAVAAVLAVLACGAAYVPLDPTFPADRLEYMADAAGAGVLLADRANGDLARRLTGAGNRGGGGVVFVEQCRPAPLRPAPANLDDPAYALFTSGSTGTPKGILNNHRNLLHAVTNQITTLGITPDDRLSLLASLSFDAALVDIFPALLTGAALVPVNVRTAGVPAVLEALDRHGVTIYHSTPTVYRYLTAAMGTRSLDRVRIVLLGGEQAGHADLARGRGRFAPGCRLVNGYGATEVTFAAQYQVSIDHADPGASGPLPIGSALPGYEIVLAATGAPDTTGAPNGTGTADGTGAPNGTGTADTTGTPNGTGAPAGGEIVVRSRFLVRGYLDRDSDRFSVTADGRHQYRTGDLGTVSPSGLLLCLGRLDRQVKIRGFRVELSEIETCLASRPGVTAARAIVRRGEILGYVTLAAGMRSGPDRGPVSVPDLRAGLADLLPDFAVPRSVLAVRSFPLTVTGKLDEPALPDPPAPVPAVAPVTPTERAIHDDWCAVLGVPRVGCTDGFFDAGGHSLLLGVLAQRLSLRFGRPVPLARLLEHPTIGAQARLFDRPGRADGHSAPVTAPPTAVPPAMPTVTPPAVPPAPASSATPGSAPATPGSAPATPGSAPATPDSTPATPAGRPEPAAVPAPAATGDDRREYTGDEIAVVGVAGRFPGADDVATLWRHLRDGVDGIHDYTDAELAELGIGPRLRADPAHVRAGGRLTGVAEFDAGFFGFTPGEAARTDPQHRLFLESAWQAMEDAGHDPGGMGMVGVFAAASVNRYLLFHLMDNPGVVGTPDPDDWEARLPGRQLSDHLPGQVAYRLGLTGPAVAVQSACSSSLVAVCLAAQSLADYRCDAALAGGVSVTWPRQRYAPGGMASADGRCRAFDVAADGSGFSSGAAVVVLRRLADAIADRDHVYAILPGWAVTNDGAQRAGYAVPGPAGQANAVAEALAAAGVSPEQVRLVEAHGSGTPLGDAIEVTALNSVFAGAGPNRCALGSIKTNIGHLDAAAGVAGLIKAVLAVHSGVIPPNLHFTRAHPEVDLAGGPFYVPVRQVPWPGTGRRVAGVSSFGIGGTNAHVIVEQAPPSAGESDRGGGPYLLPVSARTPGALRERLELLRNHLLDTAADLADVAYTLAVGRRAFPYRVVVTAASTAAAVGEIGAILDAPDQPPDQAGAVPPDQADTVPPDQADTVPPDQADTVPPDQAGAVPPDQADAARRWVAGAEVDWAALAAGRSGRRISLPGYPFQRVRHWIDPPGATGTAGATGTDSATGTGGDR